MKLNLTVDEVLSTLRAVSMSSNFTVATHIDANASLISKTSTSASERPDRPIVFGIASTGASPVPAGSTPTDAHARTVPNADSPRLSLAMASTAAAFNRDLRGLLQADAARA